MTSSDILPKTSWGRDKKTDDYPPKPDPFSTGRFNCLLPLTCLVGDMKVPPVIDSQLESCAATSDGFLKCRPEKLIWRSKYANGLDTVRLRFISLIAKRPSCGWLHWMQDNDQSGIWRTELFKRWNSWLAKARDCVSIATKAPKEERNQICTTTSFHQSGKTPFSIWRSHHRQSIFVSGTNYQWEHPDLFIGDSERQPFWKRFKPIYTNIIHSDGEITPNWNGWMAIDGFIPIGKYVSECLKTDAAGIFSSAKMVGCTGRGFSVVG